MATDSRKRPVNDDDNDADGATAGSVACKRVRWLCEHCELCIDAGSTEPFSCPDCGRVFHDACVTGLLCRDCEAEAKVLVDRATPGHAASVGTDAASAPDNGSNSTVRVAATGTWIFAHTTRQQRCAVCSTAAEDFATACELCLKFYHLKCAALESQPRGAWRCSTCVTQFGAPRRLRRCCAAALTHSSPLSNDSVAATRRSSGTQIGALASFRALFSRPAVLGSTTRRASRTLRCVHSDPNVYVVDNFLTAKECAFLQQLVDTNRHQFSRSFTDNAAMTASTTAGTETFDPHRTSTFMWLPRHFAKPTIAIEQRAAALFGVDQSKVEPFQIVSYTRGQRFNLHHDAGTLLPDMSVELAHPRRLFSIFVYINTLPSGTGQTRFPRLVNHGEQRGLACEPVAASCAVWCNLRADGTADERLVHRACPVGAGVRKIGMNVWISEAAQGQ